MAMHKAKLFHLIAIPPHPRSNSFLVGAEGLRESRRGGAGSQASLRAHGRSEGGGGAGEGRGGGRGEGDSETRDGDCLLYTSPSPRDRG
eukprot:2431389-Rhodomonas_salina.1